MGKPTPVMKTDPVAKSRTMPFTEFTQNPARSGLKTCLGLVDQLSEEGKQAMSEKTCSL